MKCTKYIHNSVVSTWYTIPKHKIHHCQGRRQGVCLGRGGGGKMSRYCCASGRGGGGDSDTFSPPRLQNLFGFGV